MIEPGFSLPQFGQYLVVLILPHPHFHCSSLLSSSIISLILMLPPGCAILMAINLLAIPLGFIIGHLRIALFNRFKRIVDTIKSAISSSNFIFIALLKTISFAILTIKKRISIPLIQLYLQILQGFFYILLLSLLLLHGGLFGYILLYLRIFVDIRSYCL